MVMTVDVFVLLVRNHYKQKITAPTERIILPISQELTVQQHTKVPFTLWPNRKFKKHFMNPR